MLYVGKVARTYRLDEGLVSRLESRAAELGQSHTVFVTRALEDALGESFSSSSVLPSGARMTSRGVESQPDLDPPDETPREEPPAERSPDPGAEMRAAALERQRRLNKSKGM